MTSCVTSQPTTPPTHTHPLQGNKDEVVDDFLAQRPDLPAFLAKIEHYDNILAELTSAPHISAVGCVLVDTKPALRTLSKEAAEWADRFLDGLRSWVTEQASAMVEFFEDARAEVEKPVSTLDDVLGE